MGRGRSRGGGGHHRRQEEAKKKASAFGFAREHGGLIGLFVANCRDCATTRRRSACAFAFCTPKKSNKDHLALVHVTIRKPSTTLGETRHLLIFSLCVNLIHVFSSSLLPLIAIRHHWRSISLSLFKRVAAASEATATIMQKIIFPFPSCHAIVRYVCMAWKGLDWNARREELGSFLNSDTFCRRRRSVYLTPSTRTADPTAEEERREKRDINSSSSSAPSP